LASSTSASSVCGIGLAAPPSFGAPNRVASRFSRRCPSPAGLMAGSSNAAFDFVRFSSFWSNEKKKNALSRRSGPPTDPPNWCWLKSSSFVPSELRPSSPP
jgi:hypothetical protein